MVGIITCIIEICSFVSNLVWFKLNEQLTVENDWYLINLNRGSKWICCSPLYQIWCSYLNFSDYCRAYIQATTTTDGRHGKITFSFTWNTKINQKTKSTLYILYSLSNTPYSVWSAFLCLKYFSILYTIVSWRKGISKDIQGLNERQIFALKLNR